MIFLKNLPGPMVSSAHSKMFIPSCILNKGKTSQKLEDNMLTCGKNSFLLHLQVNMWKKKQKMVSSNHYTIPIRVFFLGVVPLSFGEKYTCFFRSHALGGKMNIPRWPSEVSDEHLQPADGAWDQLRGSQPVGKKLAKSWIITQLHPITNWLTHPMAHLSISFQMFFRVHCFSKQHLYHVVCSPKARHSSRRPRKCRSPPAPSVFMRNSPKLQVRYRHRR